MQESIELRAALRSIGLNEREADLYLDLLAHGPSSPTQASHRIGVQRPNIYEIAKNLAKEGLLHYEPHNGKRRLVAEQPKALVHRSEQQLEQARGLVPFLLGLNTQSGFASNIAFYEGRNTMRRLVFDALTAKGKEIWYLWPPKDMDKILGKEVIEEFIHQRIAKKIHIRSLRPAGKESFYKQESNTLFGKSLTEVAYVGPEYDFSLAVAIYDHKTAFFSSRLESIGFLVVSREFTEVMRMFYQNLWEHSGELRKE